MKTFIKLPLKIALLPVVLIFSIITLIAKAATHVSAFVLSPAIFLCGIFSVYCAFTYGFLGFLIAASVSAAGFLLLLTAFLMIEIVEGVNVRLIGFLRS